MFWADEQGAKVLKPLSIYSLIGLNIKLSPFFIFSWYLSLSNL